MSYNREMQWVKGLCLFGLSFGIVFGAALFAHAADVSFVSNPLWLSTSKTTEGETVQASTVITKKNSDAISGTVAFFANGKEVGTSDFSLPSNVGGVVVAVSFAPGKGTYAISAKITSAVSNNQNITVAEEVKAKETLTIDPDNDRDKVSDANDPDDDNDGISDSDEKKNGTDPLKKEVVAKPEVAGAATTSASGIIAQAKSIAGPIGESVFQTTEHFRLNSAEYFDKKLQEAEAQKKAKQASAAEIESIDDRAEGGMKPLSEQFSDGAGILSGLKGQLYWIGANAFGNVYAFYIIVILMVLWIIRKIWRRYSLN